MERKLSYNIEKAVTVGEFLKRELHLTKRQISSLKFRENGISVNGVRKRVNEVLEPGMELVLRIEEEEKASHHLVNTKGDFRILHEDEDVLVVDKPAGILVHPVGGHFSDTLSNMAAAYYREKGQQVVIRPVGRLDKETSGAVLFAKNQLSAARLSGEKNTGGFTKEYLAIVQGHFQEAKGEITAPIGACPGKILKMQVDPQNGKHAHTAYQVLETFSGTSLVRVWIATGRTHQIRVHMASVGHPLLGDCLYGEDSMEFGRVALHAAVLQFQQPFSGERLCIRAPLPKDFEDYLRKREYHGIDNTLLY